MHPYSDAKMQCLLAIKILDQIQTLMKNSHQNLWNTVTEFIEHSVSVKKVGLDAVEEVKIKASGDLDGLESHSRG